MSAVDVGAARRLLEQPPAPPIDPDRFSSNTLFGQPGIYPSGSPMQPATGDPADEADAVGMIERLVDDALVDTALGHFGSPHLVERVPDAALRAALLVLSGGPAEPVLDAFLVGSAPVDRLEFGTPDGNGRVVGLRPSAPAGSATRVVNDRYRSEHPALIAPSLAHALCHHGDQASRAEEATLHGLLAAAHIWLLASDPALADLGTELSRRQASLTISLLNARAPGSWRASIRCPDGAGTIPGGNPSLQGPDLWSIPFNDRRADECELSVPPPVRASLARLAPDTAPPPGNRYDEQLGRWMTDHMGDGVWFGPVVRARAGLALGLLDA